MKATPQDFVGLLFHSRDVAHRAHFNAETYAEHVALGAFYDEIIDLADRFTEAWMGRNGQKIGDISSIQLPEAGIAKTLRVHMNLVEENRKFVPKDDTPLNNLIDEIVELYLKTLYMLTLK